MWFFFHLYVEVKEDAENAQDVVGNTCDNHIRVEIPFSNMMAKFFEGSDMEKLIQHMSLHIKAQVENPRMPESGFCLDKMIHLHINFHKLALRWDSSYIKLPEWIAKKKAAF